MSRPSATVLLESHNKHTHKTEQILKSDGIWAVYYNNLPINIKTLSIIAFVAPKYKNVSFSNKGHAINLAKRLNKLFSTRNFTVVILSHAEIIYSE
jgi:hypothetical protein